MNHEWKIGELAVRIDDPRYQRTKIDKTVIGHIYDVAWVGWKIFGSEEGIGLRFTTMPLPSGEAYNAKLYRPLDDSDKQRITEKYKDSLPKRSLVKDDDAALKRIEELNREVRG